MDLVHKYRYHTINIGLRGNESVLPVGYFRSNVPFSYIESIFDQCSRIVPVLKPSSAKRRENTKQIRCGPGAWYVMSTVEWFDDTSTNRSGIPNHSNSAPNATLRLGSEPLYLRPMRALSD